MRRSSLLSIALVALSFGCANSNPGLSIDAVLVPSETCGFSTASPGLVEGVLDTNPDVPVRVRPGGVRYVAVLRVANRLINSGNRVYPIQADTNVINLESAEVEILNTDGSRFAFADGLPNPFRVSATGTIASSVTNEPQFGLSVVELIPAQYGAGLAGLTSGTLVLSIRIIGVTLAGAVLVSGRTILPITLCSGCLFQCVVDPMTGDPIESLACSAGQDSVSDTCAPTP